VSSEKSEAKTELSKINTLVAPRIQLRKILAREKAMFVLRSALLPKALRTDGTNNSSD